MIEVKNLVKKYGDHTAVDHLSFTVEKGQIYGFLGPNGAGKSTTMNIMTGYLGATDGTHQWARYFEGAASGKKKYRLSAGAASIIYGYDCHGIS